MRALRLAVAALLGAAATTLVVAAPAQAAACTRGTGVTVVVQGQGINSTRCLSSPRGSSADDFGAAGFGLSYAKRQPGFVCRVNGRPASDPCVNASPADAYWGLFWSDGKSGSWVYSTRGAGALNVPKGGWVAFVFQDGGKNRPNMSPIGPAAQPKPKPKPTAPASTATPSAPANTASPTPPTPSASHSASAGAATSGDSGRPGSGSEPGATSDDLRRTSHETDDGGSSTTLLWVAGGLAIALAAGGGVTAWSRSRRP